MPVGVLKGAPAMAFGAIKQNFAKKKEGMAYVII